MNSRNQSLDVLRGIAVLMVICCHYPLLAWFRGGEFGVDLFFVLSGFLISGLLFADLKAFGTIRLSRFFLRRGFKLYPAFYFLILFTYVAMPQDRGSGLAHSALFLQNYLGYPRILGHTWSLAVEEHFYIVLPFLLLALAKTKRLHWLPAISAILVLMCFFLRGISELPVPLVIIRSHMRADALFAGVTIGFLYHCQHDKFAQIARYKWFALAGTALALPGITIGWQENISHWTLSLILALNVIAYSVLVLWALHFRLQSRFLAWVGRYSYSIYLWHFVITWGWRVHFVTVGGLLFAIAMSLGIGAIMSVAIEMPMLKLRERITHSSGNHLKNKSTVGREADLQIVNA